jgi:hydrogenase expression/formation protein HypC
MCLAVPAEVVELLNPGSAKVRLGGVAKAISIDLVPDAAIGDYVVVHAGYALGKIDPTEAQRTLDLLSQAAKSEGAAA